MKASNIYQTENSPFAIIEAEEGGFYIVLGDQLATRKCFKSKEDAETFLEKTNWEIFVTLISVMTENIIQKHIFKDSWDTKEENNMQND